MITCQKCGTLLVPKRSKKNTIFYCRKCGKTYNLNKDITIESKIKTNSVENVIISGGEREKKLPKAKSICPKCGNEEAFYYIQQTRGADEPPTIFYTCTKCNYSWRSFE